MQTQAHKLTAAQLVAVVGGILGVLVAYGAPISDAAQQSVLHLTYLLAPVLIVADGFLQGLRQHGAERALADLLADIQPAASSGQVAGMGAGVAPPAPAQPPAG